MLKILGDRAPGKTVRLIKEAIDNNAIFVTTVDKECVIKTALDRYGTKCIKVLTPSQFVEEVVIKKSFPKGTKVVIDELSYCLNLIFNNIDIIGCADDLYKTEIVYRRDWDKNIYD